MSASSTPVQALPRNALLWLMSAVAVSLLPHSGHLPWVFALFVAFVMAWRWLMYKGRFPFPGKWAKTIAVVLTVVGILLGFAGDFSVESATAFFVATSLLKVMEMRSRRDGYVVCFLAYFISAAGFLFEQGLVWGLYGILSFWLITSALVSLHLYDNRPLTRKEMSQLNRAALTHGTALVLTALPMMLILYLLFPRFGPLWNVGLKSNQARTGLSSQVTPGDIANLTNSDELVMRITFMGDDAGHEPPTSKRYWRALVLDQYEDRTWKSSGWRDQTLWYPQVFRPKADAEGLTRYEIIQEASGERWLYTLRNGTATQRGQGITASGTLVQRAPVFKRIRYQGMAFADYELFPGFITAGAELELDDQSRRDNLRLPDGVNPRTREWAEQLSQQYQPAELVGYLLEQFRQQPFFYSLSPPTLGNNDIDEFLFESRTGFCAHYAGSLAFLARAAGIPARMVAGYQGGEWNETENYLTIRQYDAHAWNEIWLEGRGWVRVDPTAAVSPERIDFGIDALLNSEEALQEAPLLSERRLRQFGLLNAVMLEFERMNYLWYRWVLSFDSTSQRNFLSRWTAQLSWKRMLIGGLAVVGTLVFLILAWRGWRWYRTRPPRLSRAWTRLRARAEGAGIQLSAGDTPLRLLEQIATRLPEQKEKIRWIKKDVERLLYQPESEDQRLLEQRVIKSLRRLARQLSPALEVSAGQAQKQPLPEMFTKGP